MNNQKKEGVDRDSALNDVIHENLSWQNAVFVY